MGLVKSRLVGICDGAGFAVTSCCFRSSRDVAPVSWACAASFLRTYSFGNVQGSVSRVQGRTMQALSLFAATSGLASP